ncbi:hypothetical protein [Pseudomonas sp. NFACC37-1]|uniref:hypothetical protein n=1 Tax=Pseudomonas sp. NFACC37-1 TaxID=1566196 RepID=UPI000881E878|nr:hypothetical protein [Pseudomonas sp. NFACC37-1]SCZ12731.1 hypothetical protein SAMN03159391_05738 [Pseudomonas sp. NFACC37-1]
MAFVTVKFTAPGGYQFTEQRGKEPALDEVVMIGADPFVVRAVMVPDYWTAYGEVNQHRVAHVVLACKSLEAA